MVYLIGNRKKLIEALADCQLSLIEHVAPRNARGSPAMPPPDYKRDALISELDTKTDEQLKDEMFRCNEDRKRKDSVKKDSKTAVDSAIYGNYFASPPVAETEPVTPPAQTANAQKVEAVKGITKNAVISAFSDMYFDSDKWSKYLGDPPKWLTPCRVARGDKNTSALWNPADIALALLDKKIPIKKLDAVFVDLNDWADEWREKTELERN